MEGLTKEQAEKYLANGGHRCPFCDSTNIESTTRIDEELDLEGGVAFQRVICWACGRKWTDEYQIKLVNVTAN